jgi:acyl-CoA oxidase
MAATIAVRYSAVRRQGFTDRGDGSEVCVLDYAMQQSRLLPVLANSFAFQITGAAMVTLLKVSVTCCSSVRSDTLQFCSE